MDSDVSTSRIVFYMSFGINKMSASKAQTTFGFLRL